MDHRPTDGRCGELVGFEGAFWNRKKPHPGIEAGVTGHREERIVRPQGLQNCDLSLDLSRTSRPDRNHTRNSLVPKRLVALKNCGNGPCEKLANRAVTVEANTVVHPDLFSLFRILRFPTGAASVGDLNVLVFEFSYGHGIDRFLD